MTGATPIFDASKPWAGRQVPAPLRNHVFHDPASLNRAIAARVRKINRKPYADGTGENRFSRFDSVDAPHMRPLPDRRWQRAVRRRNKVHPDYRIAVDYRFYSAPCRHIGKQVDVRLRGGMIDAFYRGRQIASHPGIGARGRATTLEQHKPKAHQRAGVEAARARARRPWQHSRTGVLQMTDSAISHPLARRIASLRLPGMLAAFEEQMARRDLVERRSRALQRRLKKARLRHQDACFEDIDLARPRGLSRSVVLGLGDCARVRNGANVPVTGPCGTGKSWIACALAHKACLEGFQAQYLRMPRLPADLLEILDGRFGRSSAIVTSQLPGRFEAPGASEARARRFNARKAARRSRASPSTVAKGLSRR